MHLCPDICQNNNFCMFFSFPLYIYVISFARLMLEHKVKYDMICSILKSTRSHQAHFSQGAGGETTGGGGGKSSSSPAMSCPTARHPSQRSMTVSGEITTGYKAERASSPQITLEKSPHQVPKSLSAQRSSPPPRSRRVTRQARSRIWFFWQVQVCHPHEEIRSWSLNMPVGGWRRWQHHLRLLHAEFQ